MVKHYFFVRNLNSKLAGVESATKKRLQLFLEMMEPCVIATSSKNDFLKQAVEKHGISYNNVVNIYRYYQKPNKPMQPYTLQLLKQQQPAWRFDKLGSRNAYRIYDQNDVYIMYLSCFEDDKVNYMNFFDVNKKKFKRIICDEFGNASREVLLDANQKVICERFLDCDERVCIEEHYTVNEQNEHILTAIHLIQQDVLHVFSSEVEFIGHWMSDLADEGECIFYLDRNLVFSQAVPYLRKKVPIYPILHSVHTRNAKRMLEAPVNRNYEVILADSSPYAGYIVSTAFQKRELLQRFRLNKPVSVIPVGYKNERLYIPIKERSKNKIVVPSRFSPEKRLHHIVEALDLVRKQVPDVQLHFYGFNTSSQTNVKQQIEEMVEKRQLQQHVTIHDFTVRILDELDDATAYVMTSTDEGFCLTLLEALSCGVPAFCYDIRYGPSDMIQQGLNGFLIEDGNIAQLAQLLTTYLQNDEMKQRMSNRAYKLADYFDKESIKQKWQQLIAAHK